MNYSSPTYVPIEITSRCNLHCKHCYGNFPRNEEYEMTTQQIMDIIDDLYNVGVFRIEIGGGEPTVREDFLDILRHVSTLEDISISVVTNGICLDEKKVKELSEFKHNNICFHISMDGYNNESYKFLRNKDDIFEKIIENTKLMIRYGIDVRWNFAVGKKNINYLKKTIELAKSTGVKIIRLMVLYNTGRAIDNELGFTYTEFQSFLVRYMKDEFYDPNVSVSLALTQPFECLVPLMEYGYSKDEILKKIICLGKTCFDDKLYKKLSNMSCTAGRVIGAIDSIGNFHFCCMLTGNKELSGGNLFQNSLKEIWDNSYNFNWIRSLKIEDLNTNCYKCKYKDVCGGGCRARAYYASGDFLGPDPLCPFVEKENKTTNRYFSPQIVYKGYQKDKGIIKSHITNKAFNLLFNGQAARIRYENFGAMFYYNEKYFMLNKSSLEILKIYHEVGCIDKTVEKLSVKYHMPATEIKEKVVNLFNGLFNY